MSVKIKLKRLGKIRNPQYRIVVADARNKRDGRAIEELGLYHPKEEPSLIRIDSERAQYWLGVGAQPTDAVRVLLKITGDWQKFKGEPGQEGTLRVAEPKANKLDAFNDAIADGEKAKSEKPKKKELAPEVVEESAAVETAEVVEAKAETEAAVEEVVAEADAAGDEAVASKDEAVESTKES